jgi:hypothetical protein
MVIGNFNIMGMTVLPMKADPPSIIDPDAPLACSIAGKLFQPVPRRDSQKRQCRCAVDQGQFAQGHPLYFIRKAGGQMTMKDPFCLFAAKRLDHGLILTSGISIVKH